MLNTFAQFLAAFVALSIFGLIVELCKTYPDWRRVGLWFTCQISAGYFSIICLILYFFTEASK